MLGPDIRNNIIKILSNLIFSILVILLGIERYMCLWQKLAYKNIQ